MSRLSAKRIQRYYTDTQQAAGLSSNTMRRHHDLLSSALRSRGAAGYASGLAHGPGGAAAVPGQGRPSL